MITNKLLFTAIALLYGINTSTYYEVKSSKRIRQVNREEYQRILKKHNEEYMRQNNFRVIANNRYSDCADYCSTQPGSNACIKFVEMWQKNHDFHEDEDIKLILGLSKNYIEREYYKKEPNEADVKELISLIKSSSHEELINIAQSSQETFLAQDIKHYIIQNDIFCKQELMEVMQTIEKEMQHLDPEAQIDLEKEINAFPGIIGIRFGNFPVEIWEKIDR